MMPLQIKVWGFEFTLHVDEKPLANLIGNVVTDVMERQTEGESRRVIGFVTGHVPQEPLENERRV